MRNRQHRANIHDNTAESPVHSKVKTRQRPPVKTIRLQRKQTLQEVARAVGTDAGNLSRIENGKQRASPELAERLVKHFGYAITEIEVLYPERFTAR